MLLSVWVCLSIWLDYLSICLSVYLSIDFLQKWKAECRADGLVPCFFPSPSQGVGQCVSRFFHAISLKYCACQKVTPAHTRCCTTQNHLTKPIPKKTKNKKHSASRLFMTFLNFSRAWIVFLVLLCLLTFSLLALSLLWLLSPLLLYCICP